MIRLSTLFWLATVAIAGFSMFAVKYEVQSLADQLVRISKQADDAERDLRALAADWAFLNRPDALAALNQRLLSLVPITTKQLRTSLADLPMRPAPPPAPPETAVADAGGATMAVASTPAPTMPATAALPAVSPAAAAPAPTPVASATPSPPAQPATPGDGPPDQTVVALDTATAARPGVPGSGPSDDTVIALDTATAARPAAPAGAKTVARASRPHRATSLDELIAQITESR